MPRVVAYIRVSTNKQETENQRFEIERYAASNGLVVTQFIDETISGTKPVADRLLGSTLKGMTHGDTIIVSEASRISRKLREIFNVIGDCVDRGITVIAIKQNFVFRDDVTSQVIAFAFGLASQIERDLIASRTREALARRKAEGKPLGRPSGTGNPEHRKLHGKDEAIIELLRARVPKAAIARIHEVNVKTLTAYMDEKNLEYELRNRKLQELMKKEGTWKGTK